MMHSIYILLGNIYYLKDLKLMRADSFRLLAKVNVPSGFEC
uniref:Uncharacterized protein n=1 Tax=Arundo donax TaxID=35708 RepID=A0A0A9DXU7_ARUDO